jgi:N-acetylglucosaminyldiphosphoundecaprenol N-acetyl-beta-D-mannosaminyltransferase
VSEGTTPRFDVLGVQISAVDMAGALAEITRWINEGDRHYVCVTGVHGVMEAQRDETLRLIHNRSGLTTPDGMPMVWAGRYAGFSGVKRVYGPDLMLAMSERAAQRGWSCYLYGGKEGVADRAAARLVSAFPRLRIVGSYSPPFRALTDPEDIEVIERINGSKPDIVWVGLSTPKQEHWMAAHRDKLTAPVLIGVGAAFDIHAGVVRQAPLWMQRSGLEWLFRMGIEPRRLARRYLSNNPRFVIRVLRSHPRPARFSTDYADSDRSPAGAEGDTGDTAFSAVHATRRGRGTWL